MEPVKKAMRDALLQQLLEQMQQRDDIFFVTADFGSPVIDHIKEQFPDRFINVGIAEQNLINVSAGLALEGFTVYAYAIAPFITMRCYEQIRVNLAILSQVRPMNVNLIGVGAGYSYVVSGPTHQCLEDLSIMRTLPNMEFFSPCDWTSAAAVIPYTLENCGPKYIRLDAQPLNQIYEKSDDINIEQGFKELIQGKETVIISTGFMTRRALEVSQTCGKEVGVIDLFMLKSLDEEALAKVLEGYKNIISIEEGFTGKGGLDSFILHFLNKHQLCRNFHNLGLSDTYNFHIGSRDSLHDKSETGNKKLLEIINGL